MFIQVDLRYLRLLTSFFIHTNFLFGIWHSGITFLAHLASKWHGTVWTYMCVGVFLHLMVCNSNFLYLLWNYNLILLISQEWLLGVAYQVCTFGCCRYRKYIIICEKKFKNLLWNWLYFNASCQVNMNQCNA